MIANMAIICGLGFGTLYFGIYSLFLIKKNADLENDNNSLRIRLSKKHVDEITMGIKK